MFTKQADIFQRGNFKLITAGKNAIIYFPFDMLVKVVHP